MDRVKEYLAIAGKYSFWIVTGLVILVGAFTWWYSSASMADEYQTNKQKISQADSGVTQVVNRGARHPNEQYNTGMQELIAQRRRSVSEAWALKYRTQREEVLRWPSELTQQFIREIEKLVGDEPIEEVAEKLNSGEIKELRVDFREQYRDYFEKEMPKVAERMGAPWQPKSTPGGLDGEGGGPPIRPGGESGQGTEADDDDENAKKLPVVWRDQAEVLAWLKGRWSGVNGEPTTVELLYVQEDLWVLQALSDIIRKTNGGATRPENLVVREVVDIQLGRETLNQVSRVQRLVDPNQDPNATGPEGQPAGPPLAGGHGGQPPTGPTPYDGEGGLTGPGSPGQGAGPDPAAFRYVDINYDPLSAEDLKAALGTKEDKDKAYLAVAKRMPIRLRLKMDTRRLNRLLVECGNSPLPVEVRQVRIGVTGSSSGAPGGFSGGEGYGRGGTGPSLPPIDGGFGPPEDYGSGRSAQKTPYLKMVEVYGIIYIFNPVNYAQLGYENGKPPADLGAEPGNVPTPPTTEPETPESPETPQPMDSDPDAAESDDEAPEPMPMVETPTPMDESAAGPPMGEPPMGGPPLDDTPGAPM